MKINKQRGISTTRLVSIIAVIIVTFLVLHFAFTHYRIPSGSMMPTLLIGDFILVNEFSYGVRLPGLNTKIIEVGKPQRGDVVVFRYPENPSIPFMKRLVGLPGDLIEYDYATKMLSINNEPVVQTLVGIYVGMGSGSRMTGSKLIIEYLPGGTEHSILVSSRESVFSLGKEWIVPENEYFVLGDNRDNSKDSRFWGTVPEANLIGKVLFVWMNFDWNNGGFNWQRLGTQI